MTGHSHFPMADAAAWQTLLDGTVFMPARVYLKDAATPAIVVSRAHEIAGGRKINGVEQPYQCMKCGKSGDLRAMGDNRCRRSGESFNSGFAGVILDKTGAIVGTIRRRIEKKGAQ